MVPRDCPSASARTLQGPARRGFHGLANEGDQRPCPDLARFVREKQSLSSAVRQHVPKWAASVIGRDAEDYPGDRFADAGNCADDKRRR
jgi:hypothetical protein